MNDKINGFVLSQSDYKEADVLMQVYTKQYGIISLVGKASKKISSKNHFLPMCLYEFIIDYKDHKTIYSIHGSKLLKTYFEDSDIQMISFKNLICELAQKNRDINTYDELCFVFDKINKDNMYLLGSMYLSNLIKRFGITPIVDSCALCDNKKVVSLSNRHGGFLCMNHLNGEEILSIDRLKKFRLMIKGDFKNYDVLKDYEYEFKDFSLLMEFFIDNTDLRIKSYDFYRTLV